VNAGGCRPLLLMILDGWGQGPDGPYNAVTRAGAYNYFGLLRASSHRTLVCSGSAVGLPAGQMGNSEVGHLTIGSGRVVLQDLPRISRDIETGAFFENEVLRAACRASSDGTLHLMGLVSDGGVHSHLDHLRALVVLAKREGVHKLAIHAILDGRDTSPTSGLGFVQELEAFLSTAGVGAVATVMGRYWAMDRDLRWERTERAYRAFTAAEGRRAASAEEAIREGYDAGTTDEFAEPAVLRPDLGTVRDGDGILFFNFRADRARQIARAFTEEPFDGFARERRPRLATYTTFTRYRKDFDFPVAFGAEVPRNTMGETVSGAGRTQLRIAETEKYAHVTFFFNGGREAPFDREERILIPSPKVATYDLQPSMSAPEVTEAYLKRLEAEPPAFTLLNFANPDMVGHTGNFEAACEAVRVVDGCMRRIVDRILELGGAVCLTADHGNLEYMRNADGSPHTAHTTNEVPLLWIGPARGELDCENPRGLSSIAPTLLEWMGIPVPPEMNAPSLWR